MDVFIKAAEYMEIPVRRTDDEPLQKLFMLVRSELNLDLKNIKQEQAKFWKQHPALVKVSSCMAKPIESLYFSFWEHKCPTLIFHYELTSFTFSFRQSC